MTRSSLYVPALLLLSTLPSCGLVNSSEGLDAAGGASSSDAGKKGPSALRCDTDSVAPAIAEALARSLDDGGKPDPLAVTALIVFDGGLLGVQCLENLQWIDLHGPVAEDDFARLAELRKLSSLTWTNPSTIESLRMLPDLSLVTLNTGPLHDLSPLEDIVALETLQLVGLWELDSFEPIRQLPQLKSLQLFDVLLLEETSPDYSFLEDLGLESLSLFAIDGLVDFSNVSTERLRSLVLWHAPSVHLERLGPPASSLGNVELGDEYSVTDRKLFADSLCPLGWCIQAYVSEAMEGVELCPETCSPEKP